MSRFTSTLRTCMGAYWLALSDRQKPVRAPWRPRMAAQSREIFGFPYAIPCDGEPLGAEDLALIERHEIGLSTGELAVPPVYERRAR